MRNSIIAICGFGAGLLLAASASAVSLPTSFVVEKKPLRHGLVASDMLTADLYGDEACTALVASQTVMLDAVPLRESVKSIHVKRGNGEDAHRLARLHFAFDVAAVSAGALYLEVSSAVPGAVVPFPDTCQPQGPVGVGECPAGTTRLLGACFEDVLRAQADFFDAHDDCSDEGGALGSFTDLRSALETLSGDQTGEHTSDVFVEEIFKNIRITAGGDVASPSSAMVEAPYRCAFDLHDLP